MTSHKEGEVLGPELPGEREARERLRFLAWLLDSSIRIPGTRFTVGLDALIGLLPFLGDLIGVLVSSFIVGEAARLGASRTVLARMAFNVAVEGLVGLVPLAGDVFDAAWKANQRNVRLLEAWVERPRRAERASRFFVAMVVLGIAAFAAVTVSLTYLLLRWLVS
jgi:Domain of unknown function (DUF4112)